VIRPASAAPLMNIAFYAPMKTPDHPVPSGDRQMARLLMMALTESGCQVRIASRLSSFSRDCGGAVRRDLMHRAYAERELLLAAWRPSPADWRPDAWLTYHPYYKSPDWIGPVVAADLDIPYITAEAYYAPRRDAGPWGPWQADVVRAVQSAALNFCFTARDREGLQKIVGSGDRLVALRPFIDVRGRPLRTPRSTSAAGARLLTVAMMRGGDKLKSYLMLAEALTGLMALTWTLTIVGSGRERSRVAAAFAAIPPDRLCWTGEVAPEEVAAHMADADIFLWPGFGEAYGLVYLEAQAAGVPVVAQDTGGIRAVVHAGAGGLLTEAGNVAAFRGAIAELIKDDPRRERMGEAAFRLVRSEHSVAYAANRLMTVLHTIGLRGQEADP